MNLSELSKLFEKEQIIDEPNPNIVQTFIGSNATTDRRIANKIQVHYYIIEKNLMYFQSILIGQVNATLASCSYQPFILSR